MAKTNPKRGFETILVRDVNNMHIVIYDERTVYIKSNGLITYCFHRWFHSKRNFYTENWKPFILLLRKKKNFTFTEVLRMAYDLDIVVQAGRLPDLTGKNYKILD